MLKPFAFATLIVSVLLSGCASPPNPAANSTLTFLHINDHHSHLDAQRFRLKGPAVNAAGYRSIGLEGGGMARVAAAIRQRREAHRNPVFTVHAGDALTGDLFYTLSKGKADATAMNAICFDTFTLGNHEFDDGDSHLAQFLSWLGTPSCPAYALSANVRFGPGSALNPSRTSRVQPSVVLERQGQQVGFIGITTARKTARSSRPDPGTVFLDEQRSAQEEINRLTAQGVKYIVLQTHDGYDKDLQLAKTLKGVDIIIGGDSHTLLGPSALTQFGLSPQGPYPTQAHNADGDLVCVVQAGQYAQVLGELNATFNAEGKVNECHGTPWLLAAAPDQGTDANGTHPLSNTASLALARTLSGNGPFLFVNPDPTLKDAIAPYADEKKAFGQAVIAHVDALLCARRLPGPFTGLASAQGGDPCQTTERVIQHGGDAQQWVAQILLDAAHKYVKADIALHNAGGVRQNLLPGKLDVRGLYSVLPFDNQLVVLKITGHDLLTVLNHVVDAALSDQPATGAFPYAARLRWVLDARRPPGQRLQNVEFKNTGGQWVALQADRIYSLATLSYLVDGHDRYEPLAKLAQDRLDTGLGITPLILDFLKQQDEPLIERPDPENYSTRQFIPRQPAQRPS